MKAFPFNPLFKILNKLGVTTMPRATTLGVIANNPGIETAKLAEEVGVITGSIHSFVKILVKSGLVKVDRGICPHRCLPRLKYYLTEKGTQLVESLVK